MVKHRRRRAMRPAKRIFSLIYLGMRAGPLKAARIDAKLNRTMRPARVRLIFPGAMGAIPQVHLLTQQIRKARRNRALQERIQGVLQ